MRVCFKKNGKEKDISVYDPKEAIEISRTVIYESELEKFKTHMVHVRKGVQRETVSDFPNKLE